MFRVEGSGWVILECSEEVLLGMIRLSVWSLVGGRSLVRGLMLREGAMAKECREETEQVEIEQFEVVFFLLCEGCERGAQAIAISRAVPEEKAKLERPTLGNQGGKRAERRKEKKERGSGRVLDKRRERTEEP